MREARILLPGTSSAISGRVPENKTDQVQQGERVLSTGDFSWAPVSSGLVYGVILNDQASLYTLDEAFHEPPYKAPPQAPILYIKPYNTHLGHCGRVRLPAGEQEVVVSATLGLVIGTDARRVSAETALEYLRGYTVVADLGLPHASYFRPAIREKCFDGACPMGPWVVSRDALANPQQTAIRTYADGELLDEHTLEDLVRPIPQLLVDVTEFMTLKAGDVLLCGVRYQAPVIAVGSQAAVEIDGVGRLEFSVEADEQAEEGR